MAKIRRDEENTRGIAIDSMSFRSSFSYFKNQIAERKPELENTFKNRFAEVKKHMGSTSNPHQLEHLYQTETFYESVAQVLDLYEQAMAHFTRGFDQLDETYWDTVMNGEAIQKENLMLKESLRLMHVREDILMHYIRKFKAEIKMQKAA
jgi:hypothetical protein